MKLSGVSVLVTRPQHQASELVQTLQGLGAEVFSLPAIEIQPSQDNTAFDAALRALESFDTVVLTSVNGVKSLVDRMCELSISTEILASRQLAVIGPATGQALADAIRPPDVMPSEYVSEALAGALGDVKGKRILLCRADLARPDLADILGSRGAIVEQVVAYRIVRAMSDVTLPNKAPDYITLTSSAAARGTHEVLEAHGKADWMAEARLVCIGPITADTVRQLGYLPAAVADEYTVPGMVSALLAVEEKEAVHA